MNGEAAISTARRPHILVVDDEDYVADMIASMLELEGFTTTVAYNGREGLRLAQSTPNDLIILDIMMPFMSGIEVIEHLRMDQRLSAIPIILISAGARPPHPMEDVIFIAKPFNLDHLLALANTICTP